MLYSMAINIYRTSVTFIIALLLIVQGFAQTKQLPDDVNDQLKNLKINAIKNRNAGNDNAAATYLNKAAFIYWEYFIYTDAIENFEQVLSINQSIGNNHGVQKVMENLAFVYSDMQRYDKSIEYFSACIPLIEKNNNSEELASGLSNLALAYNNNGQYNEAIKQAEKGLEISKRANDLKLMRSFYGILHESYDKKGDKGKATEYFGLYATMDKHIQQQQFNEKEQLSNQKLSEMEELKDNAIQDKEIKEFELEKTQDTLKQSQMAIDLLNAESEAKEAKIKAGEAQLVAERRLRYSIMIVVVFMTILSFLIYWQMQQKKRANAALKDLNREIEKKNNQILDSINYASHIQEAILPYEKHMTNDFPGSFVYFKPRDIVSGDFYWHARHQNMVFVAAVDCTGHGVPGAFMSMIGNTLLNEIVNESGIYDPAAVLTQLNEKVAFTLNQNHNQNHGFSEDGMDITFVCYDKNTSKVKIAMANHTAICFKQGVPQIIEGDIFSIGGNVGLENIKFSNHEIDLTQDTVLYLYSDGYQDQFGGKNDQKYMATKFVNYLTEIQNKPFSEHKNLLDIEYNKWKGEVRQIDDILVIGLKF